MTRTYDKPDATKEDVIEWFGLREHDIDWFRIKDTPEPRRVFLHLCEVQPSCKGHEGRANHSDR